MKLFIKKVILLILVLFVTIGFLGLYYHIKIQKINIKKSDNAIFIWGDSQAKAGFNLEEISAITKKNVYSAAGGGTGAFDFLSFSEIVPENSFVIISISQLSLMRQRDKSHTGIPVLSIMKLISINYPELLYSIRQNIKPQKIFWTENRLYPYRDTLTYHEPLVKFQDIYNQKNDNYKIKEKAYLYGIRRLINKNCKIVFVEFPIHQNLDEVVPEKIKTEYSNFMSIVYVEFDKESVIFDTVMFSDQNRNMYDLTHLNEKGATDFSKQLLMNKEINSDKTLFISVNDGVSK